jgi:VWFA-related protein
MRAFGQASASDQKPADTTLRVTTRSIQVSVIALDKDGRPVTGLKKSDFTLLDGGQEQKIGYFAEETTSDEQATPSSASASTLNTFSNRMEQKIGSPNSATVILLDMRNTGYSEMVFAKKQVARFLSQIQPQDRVALYSLSSKLYILHDFTEDASSLVRALQGDADIYDFRLGAEETPRANTGSSNFDVAVNAAIARAAEFDMNNRAAQTALAIKTIADHLKGLTGRKNLIWVTAAFPISILTAQGPTPQSPQTAGKSGSGAAGGHGQGESATTPIMRPHMYTDEIEFAARSLNNADVAVYPVDARGLIGNPNVANKPGPRAPNGPAPPDTTSPFPNRANFDTMNTIAERTGGRAFYNSNDIQGALRKAIDDSRVTYVLGYYPTNNNWDGKFREIKIRTDKPGVHLRFRLGYYALPDMPSTEKEKELLMTDAKWSPLEATDLGIEATVDPVDASGSREIQVQLRIASNQLHFENIENRWHDSLDVVWVEIGASGKSLGEFKRTVGLDVPQESYDVLVTKGINFSQTIRPGPNAVELRLVVRDGGSDAIGSVNIPLMQIFGRAKVPTVPAAPKN